MTIDDLLKQRRPTWWEEKKSKIRVVFTSDGTLCAYNLADIKEILDKNHPFSAKCQLWYFNETKDREIANIDEGVVFCNPQVYYLYTQVRGTPLSEPSGRLVMRKFVG